MDEQLDLAGIPKPKKIIHGDDPRVTEAIAEDGEGITDILLQGFNAALSQRVGLVLIKLYQHRQFI
jgi:hypothetical protein